LDWFEAMELDRAAREVEDERCQVVAEQEEEHCRVVAELQELARELQVEEHVVVAIIPEVDNLLVSDNPTPELDLDTPISRDDFYSTWRIARYCDYLFETYITDSDDSDEE